MKKFLNYQRLRGKYRFDTVSQIIKKPKKSGQTVPLISVSDPHPFFM
jgi:hypothetical protein